MFHFFPRVGVHRNRRILHIVRSYAMDTQINNRNFSNIEMLPYDLWKQLFPLATARDSANKMSDINKNLVQQHLTQFDLWNRKAPAQQPLPNIQLPPLRGKDLKEHFENIALEQCQDYLNLAQ